MMDAAAPRTEEPGLSCAAAPSRARGALLWGRAATLAAVTLLAGTTAHASADGVLPGAPVLVALLLGGTVALAPLLGTEASRARVVLLLVAGQAVVHGLLTALGGHRDDDPAGVSGPAWLAHLTADLTGPHALMALAHAAAAAVVGLWLASGERAAWALVRQAARLLVRKVHRPALPHLARPRPRVIVDVSSGPTLRVLACSQPRRGPPYGASTRHRTDEPKGTPMRSTLVILAALVATAPALSACSSDSSSGSATTTSDSTSSSSTGSSSTGSSSTGSSSASPTAEGTTVDITIKAGKVTPNGDRVKATVGTPVTLHIDADKPGELHVHSSPEQEISFEAGTSTKKVTIDRPGIVDVEDHDLEQVIVQLQVS